ncbi:hypothetical protein DPMN_094669 [Dreissena polymorpha]|uniref:Peptidase C14 caspase domain-containing protein n=1 Tax=Dreissena polymorpha TaxID=45954 RepID=A0A9D4L554_DREPO|nr:hypothetical protein DPMN_094669 [Dreissena polymorpha]
MEPPLIPQQDFESRTYRIRKAASVIVFTLDKAMIDGTKQYVKQKDNVDSKGSKFCNRKVDVDLKLLDEFFRDNFHIVPEIELNCNATFKEIEDCVKNIDGAKNDAFFFIFLSFLNKATKKGQPYRDCSHSLQVKCHIGDSKSHDVHEYIMPCQVIDMVKINASLALKPKIFIFQADDASLLPTKMVSKGPTAYVDFKRMRIPTDADQLMIISTLPQDLANLQRIKEDLPTSSEAGVVMQPSSETKQSPKDKPQ